MTHFFNKNNFIFGACLAILMPIFVAPAFAFMLHVAQNTFHVLEHIRRIEMALLAVAMNFLLMRFYIKKWQYMHTAKGLFTVSMILILVYFFVFYTKKS